MAIEATVYVRGKDGAPHPLLSRAFPDEEWARLKRDWESFLTQPVGGPQAAARGGAYRVGDDGNPTGEVLLRFDEVIAIG